MNVTAYTFESVRTVFVELLCTPKSSMENPSLRVSGHVSSKNRTFIVEDYAENEFEVTGEQDFVDDERSCFWTWEDTECAWQSRPFKGRQVKRSRKGKRKRQRTIQKDQKSILWRWASARSGIVVRRGLCLVVQRKERQEMLVKRQWWLSDGWFSPLPARIKAQARVIPRTKARERTKKEKARKEPFLNPDQWRRIWPGLGIRRFVCQSLDWWFLDSRCWVVLYKILYCMDGGNSVEPCQPLNTRGSGSWLHTVDWIKSGNRKIQEACIVLWHHDWILPLWQIFRVRQLWDRNLQGKLHYSLSNNSTMFYQGWCAWDRWCAHFVFPLPGEKLGSGSKRRQNYMSSFWFVFLSAEHSQNGTYCVGLDESCVSANDQVAWATWSPEETCNLCHVRAKTSISSSAAPFRKRKVPPVCQAWPSCCTGTRGTKRLARASRRDLDFGQKDRRWSPA